MQDVCRPGAWPYTQISAYYRACDLNSSFPPRNLRDSQSSARCHAFCAGSAQPNRADQFTAKLLQSRYDLSVRGRPSIRRGCESAIVQSRFVLLGEEHGISQTPQFWAAVCDAAGPEGFHTMAVEEGPPPPKVLLTFGAYHVDPGLNPVHGSGIGNYVAEFAEANALNRCISA